LDRCRDVPGSTQSGQQAVGGRWTALLLWKPKTGRLLGDGWTGFQHHCHLLLLGGFGVTCSRFDQVLGFAEISLVARGLRKRVMTRCFMAMVSGDVTEIGGHS